MARRAKKKPKLPANSLLSGKYITYDLSVQKYMERVTMLMKCLTSLAMALSYSSKCEPTKVNQVLQYRALDRIMLRFPEAQCM